MKASSHPSSSKRLREKQEQERLCLRVGVVKTPPRSDAYREGFDMVDFTDAPWRQASK
jgi:hypothetical protein